MISGAACRVNTIKTEHDNQRNGLAYMCGVYGGRVQLRYWVGTKLDIVVDIAATPTDDRDLIQAA